MTVVVGVDAGGTRTTAVVGDAHTILSRAEGAAGAVRPGRALLAATAIGDTVRRAMVTARCTEADVLLVGAAGAGREGERQELERALRSEHIARRVHVTTDIKIALAAAFGRDAGIVVSAGTGSIAIGRDHAGKLWRAGGYGWQMGDEGSGYAIGRAALGAVGRAADQRGPDTLLVQRIPEAAHLPGLPELVAWAATATPAEVAALGPAVVQVASEGDVVAQGILDYAARELCQLALSLLQGFSGADSVPLAFAGGLLRPGSLLRDVITQRLATEPRLRPLASEVEPALGALHLAERMARGEEPE